jgi:hypothetical protein
MQLFALLLAFVRRKERENGGRQIDDALALGTKARSHDDALLIDIP